MVDINTDQVIDFLKSLTPDQVKDFFEIFIKNYLVGDILILDNIKKNEDTGLGACTIPQAMAVVSGIDLLGLLFGCNKDTDKTREHIFEFFRIKQFLQGSSFPSGIIHKIPKHLFFAGIVIGIFRIPRRVVH